MFASVSPRVTIAASRSPGPNVHAATGVSPNVSWTSVAWHASRLMAAGMRVGSVTASSKAPTRLIDSLARMLDTLIARSKKEPP